MIMKIMKKKKKENLNEMEIIHLKKAIEDEKNNIEDSKEIKNETNLKTNIKEKESKNKIKNKILRKLTQDPPRNEIINNEDNELNNLKTMLKEKEECIEILNTNNKLWEDEYYNIIKSIAQIEFEYNRKIENLKKFTLQKYKLIVELTEQIKDYEAQSTEIINGLSDVEKDKKILILSNEVKAIRKRIFHILTFNENINNFQEFENVINTLLEKYNSSNSKDEIKNILSKLEFLIKNYKENEEQNNEKIINNINININN